MKHDWDIVGRDHDPKWDTVLLTLWCTTCGATAYVDEKKYETKGPSNHTIEYPEYLRSQNLWPNCLTLEENANNEG